MQAKRVPTVAKKRKGGRYRRVEIRAAGSHDLVKRLIGRRHARQTQLRWVRMQASDKQREPRLAEGSWTGCSESGKNAKTTHLLISAPPRTAKLPQRVPPEPPEMHLDEFKDKPTADRRCTHGEEVFRSATARKIGRPVQESRLSVRKVRCRRLSQ